MGLAFHSRIWILLFLPVLHLSHHLPLLFLLYSINIDIRSRHNLLNFLPCWRSVFGKANHLAVIVKSFQEISKKRKICIIVGPN